MLSRFHLIPERNGQTDGRTDRFAISISRVSIMTRDKNKQLEINMHNLHGAMQYRQAPSAILTKICFF